MFSQIIYPKHALIFIQGEEWEDYCFRLGSFLSLVLCTQGVGCGSALCPTGLIETWVSEAVTVSLND